MSSPAQSDFSESIDAATEIDRALVRRVSSGDRAALGEIYERYARNLNALALRMLRDGAEAEDVVHDVFITLWKKAADFNEQRGSPCAWLFALTRNRAIDRIRTRTRHSEILSQSAAEDVAPGALSGNDNEGDPVWLREKAAAVRSAVGDLAPDQRRALELAFFGGMTQQEIAAKLETPLGTVKARIRRGLLKLREKLVLPL